MDAYHGLAASPLIHLQNPFFHPSLDPRLPFGTGAFRPLTPGEEHSLKSFHPAFGLNPHAAAAAAAAALKPSGSGGGTSGKLDNNLAFNLSRYNPLFNSISMETSMAAGRLLFNGQRVIQGQPESPSPNNSAVATSPTAMATGAGRSSSDEASAAANAAAGIECREAAGTPSSDAGTERSTPDDLRTSRRKFDKNHSFSVHMLGVFFYTLQVEFILVLSFKRYFLLFSDEKKNALIDDELTG